MDKMMNVSKKLDVVFKLIGVLLSVAFVGCFVGLGIIAVGLIFKLAPEQIGNGYSTLDLGMVEFSLAQGYAPDYKKVLFVVAMQLLLMVPVFHFGKKCVLRIRDILSPMKEGAPFHAAVGANLKKLAVHALELGVIINCMQMMGQAFVVHGYQLQQLMMSDKITKVSIQYTFDFGFLLIAAVLYLLSHVFSYGAALQKLSDETL